VPRSGVVIGCGRDEVREPDEQVGTVPGGGDELGVGLVGSMDPCGSCVARFAKLGMPVKQALQAFGVVEVDVPDLVDKCADLRPLAVPVGAGSCLR